MQQLAGNENRPRQLGNTGQIVLTKCDMDGCDCNQESPKKTTTTTTTRRPIVRGSSSPALRVRPSIIRKPPRTLKKPAPAVSAKEVKFTDQSGRLRVGLVTGTSVSSSVSTSVSGQQAQPSSSSKEDLRQRLKRLTSKWRRLRRTSSY